MFESAVGKFMGMSGGSGESSVSDVVESDWASLWLVEDAVPGVAVDGWLWVWCGCMWRRNASICVWLEVMSCSSSRSVMMMRGMGAVVTISKSGRGHCGAPYVKN